MFTEIASGARSHRPTLEQVLDQLRPRDTLVVWKLDRLGRSLRHLVDTIIGLSERGVGFWSLQEAIDTTTPGGKLVFHVFAALAEFERDLIRERTSAGWLLLGPAAATAADHRCSPGTSSRWPRRCTALGSTPWRRSPRLWGSAAPRSTVTSAKQGRTIRLHRHEEELRAARRRAVTRTFQHSYRRWRPMVERSIAWLVADGCRRVPYRGIERNDLWWSLRVAAVNLRRLLVLGLARRDGDWVLA
jgi:hypothetical protein